MLSNSRCVNGRSCFWCHGAVKLGMRVPFVDTPHVQDQPHPAVSQNGAARNPLDALHGFAQTLDDDLLLANDLIHHQAEILSSAFGNDEHALRRLLGAWSYVKSPGEPDHGVQ